MKSRTKVTFLLISLDVAIVLTTTYLCDLNMPLWYMISPDILMGWAAALGFAGPVALGYATSQMRPLSGAALAAKAFFAASSVLIVLYTLEVFYTIVQCSLHSVAPTVLY